MTSRSGGNPAGSSPNTENEGIFVKPMTPADVSPPSAQETCCEGKAPQTRPYQCCSRQGGAATGTRSSAEARNDRKRHIHSCIRWMCRPGRLRRDDAVPAQARPRPRYSYVLLACIPVAMETHRGQTQDIIRLHSADFSDDSGGAPSVPPACSSLPSRIWT